MLQHPPGPGWSRRLPWGPRREGRGGEGSFEPQKALPGLVSRDFNLASFFTFTCLGRSPIRKDKRPGRGRSQSPLCWSPAPSIASTGTSSGNGETHTQGSGFAPTAFSSPSPPPSRPFAEEPSQSLGWLPPPPPPPPPPAAPPARPHSATSHLELPEPEDVGPVLQHLDKKGIGDSKHHVRPAEEEERGRWETSAESSPGPPCPPQRAATEHSRGLRPGRVLFELTVVDGEIGTVVAAVLQRGQAAEGEGCPSGGTPKRRRPPLPAPGQEIPLPGLRGQLNPSDWPVLSAGPQEATGGALNDSASDMAS